MTYIVLRDQGLRTDGYYYESKTTIIGCKDDGPSASDLLRRAANKFHSGEKPNRGAYDYNGDTELVFYDGELEDRFWIDMFYHGEERLNDD